jgi:hypothetical protein
MFNIEGIFSKDYSEYLNHRSKIKGIVLDAIDKVKGSTIYGRPVDLNNPDDIIACLFLMNRDMFLYHEQR